ncbi:MAG TPA: multicopper oxidase family protein [Solirubrobacteraceae bacterium]|nr:multicopper oxidase family protein [Solirubrobacteraceae bacterium]
MRWRAGAMACLIAGAFVIAGLVLGTRHDDGAAAATTPTMTQPPSSAPTPAAPLTPGPGGSDRALLQPSVYTSHHGVLDVTLVASQQRVMIAGRRILAKVYNGSFTAPTLVANPGDLVEVRLVNHLDEPTNLHFHGLEVSPSGHADNIFISVAPGHTFQYRFRLPRSAPTGTFWYHSHEMVPMSQMGRFPNAASEEQVFDGLSGLLEVTGLERDLPRRLRGIPQRYLALRDVQVVGGAIADSDINSNAPTTRLVDGQLRPRLTIAPGQTQLWHIGNVGADIFYRLSLPGHSFEVVAQDGHPVIHARRVSTLLLPPGKRWDVLVQGGRRGSAPLKTLFYHEGDDNYPVTTLATLVTTGRAVRPSAPPSVISWASVDLRLAHVARKRVVVFSENPAGTVFYIDGQSYDPSKINFRAKLNTVEQWTIVNHTEETHPFHMHTYPMQLISVNGVPAAFDGYQDEIVLPPHGYVVMRVRFSGFTGETVFHCHILAHEDAGMMANILVTK